MKAAVNQAEVEQHLRLIPPRLLAPADAEAMNHAVTGWLQAASQRNARTTISPELAGFLADQLSKGRG